ncbi:hypothetical protein [Actinoplanes awajinensis]|uniref:Uncharacterized protein n=1 Tax=Actinoplanes awajinensis subsp. mycoplanecinus TaxID=135947 RepID=A0A117MKH1_9ACTN|nr:hypothetical protein [Actinoplanes awajinensis]KUL22359.1 hypothetical protein ADL15_48365 [Actinoplanes awajinensis subsp. mycoplanecinus]
MSAGDKAFWSDVANTIYVPICRLIQTTAQSAAFTNNADVLITFGTSSELFDTHGWHSETTNNSRITPNIAGIYEAVGAVYWAARADYTTLQASIKKNGSTTLETPHRVGPNATNTVRSVHHSPVEIAMNGTTDYLELYGLQTNTAAAAASTFVNATSTSFFRVKYLRPL